jgi:hypothetical protein
MKKRILLFLAKFGGKLMFAALKLNGSKEMLVVDPFGDASHIDFRKVELLMEFPRQAWF